MSDDNVFDLTTRLKPKQDQKPTTEMELDYKAWQKICAIINEDVADNSKKKRNSAAAILGLSEYAVMSRMCTRIIGHYLAPKTINSIPVYLIPLETFCAVVPEAPDFFRDFSD